MASKNLLGNSYIGLRSELTQNWRPFLKKNTYTLKWKICLRENRTLFAKIYFTWLLKNI